MILYLIGKLEKKDRRKMFLYSVFSFISSIIDLASIYVMMQIINVAIRQEVTTKSLLMTAGMGCLLLVKGGFDIILNRLSSAFVNDSLCGLSLKLYDLHNKESMLAHKEKTDAQVLEGIRRDAEVCVGMILNAIQGVIKCLLCASYALILIWILGWIGIVSCLIVCIFMLFQYKKNQKNIQLFGEQKRSLSIKLNSLVTVAYGAYKEMKIDSRNGNMRKRFEETSKEFAELQRRYSLYSAMPHIVMANMMKAAIFFILTVLLGMGVDLTAYIAVTLLFFTVLLRLIGTMTGIVDVLNRIRYGEKSYNMFRKNMEQYETIIAQEAERNQLRKKTLTLQQGIRAKNLTFHYPNGTCIFEQADIEIPAGHTVAIIGPSGIGKTTLLDLLIGLLKPESGTIYYDDYDIVSECDGMGKCRADVGEVVSYIPQIVYLDGSTVRENILFLTPREEEDEERIIACLQCAQIWEDVQKMPEGMDTVLGLNGIKLSNGQRQRIALARALYKEFELMIMDEATAALDPETEKALIDSIRHVKKGKTLLMVTHHMSLADECEYVYRIENKKIVRVR